MHTPSLMKNQVLIKSADSPQILFRQNDYIIESLLRFQQRSLKGEQVLTTYFEKQGSLWQKRIIWAEPSTEVYPAYHCQLLLGITWEELTFKDARSLHTIRTIH